MKKLVLSLLMASVIVVASGDVENERVKTMQNFEGALATIQKGFLYNNESLVKQGVEDFQKNLRDSNSFVIDISKKESTGKFDARTYANTEARAISKLVDRLEENYKTGTKLKSVAIYNEIVDRCLTCHRIIRKW